MNEILIVDDEQQILVALQETLKRKGYTVSTAGSAVEALRVLRRSSTEPCSPMSACLNWMGWNS